MAMPRTKSSPGKNRLLDLLPLRDRERLEPLLERHHFRVRDPVYNSGQPIDEVHFPLVGVLSYVIRMKDGAAVEVATIGNEGLVGTQVFLGADRSPTEVFCQIESEVLRMQAEDFRRVLATLPALVDLVRRYTQALMNQISQSTACNHLHSIEQRTARWLLMCHDRVGRDDFPLTQEFLAQMLAVRRASVTVAAGILQKQSLIAYVRGQISILDRRGLEHASCECYEVVTTELERLLA
jgi:CRP-like cAMP-binding protein